MEQEMWFILEEGERISKLIVRHGDIVDSIKFVITDKNGGNSIKYISNSNNGEVAEITFGPEEYITRVSGRYASYYGGKYISTISFYTNLNEAGYGPYGTGARSKPITAFSTPIPFDGTIIGFFGSSAAPTTSTPYVASIGVYAKYGPYGR